MKKYTILACLSFAFSMQTTCFASDHLSHSEADDCAHANISQIKNEKKLQHNNFLSSDGLFQADLKPYDHIHNLHTYKGDCSYLNDEELQEQVGLMAQYGSLLVAKSFSNMFSINSIEPLVWGSHWLFRAGRLSGNKTYETLALTYLNLAREKNIDYDPKNYSPFFYKAYAIRRLEDFTKDKDAKITLLSELSDMVQVILDHKKSDTIIHAPASLLYSKDSPCENHWYKTMFSDLEYDADLNSWEILNNPKMVLKSIKKYKKTIQ